MKLKENVKKNINWIIYSFIIFILIHAPKFIVNYPCWDTPGALSSRYQSMADCGRWFYGIAKIVMSSRYDLQWIEGIVAGVLVAFSSVMMMELLQIKSRRCRAILSLLIAGFPSMTATFVYQFCAPAYMLALFLAILAVYVIKESMTLWSACIAMICLALSLGCYQIYYIVALSMLLYTVFSKLARGEKLVACKSLVLYFAFAYFGGAVLYKLIDIILRKIFNYTLSSYQGINMVGDISWVTVLRGIIKIIKELLDFYSISFSFNGGFYSNCHKIIILLFIINTFIFVFFNNKINLCSKITVVTIILISLPLTYSLYLITGGNIFYHSLMLFGNIFFYIPLLLYYEIANEEKVLRQSKHRYCIKRYISVFSLMALFFLGCYHAINANVTYKRMEQSSEITRFQTIEILTKIDEVSEVGIEKLAIIGSFQTTASVISARPNIIGITYNFLTDDNSFINYSRYYYARNFEVCDTKTKNNIRESEEFKCMNCYPRGDYVKKIGGVIVVKLSEEEGE